MLRPVPIPGSHEDLFIARYERLIGWALRLTAGDRHAAEDLVHDAFIQFTLKQPDISAIESLDNYLYTTLRNLHISQARRTSQISTIPLAIIDYDTARMGLRLADPQRQLQSRDDLRRVCEFVAQRKETSKAASVLILRFFHSYFPIEIASILRTTRQAVEIWLLNARRESRLYLEDPKAIRLIHTHKANAKSITHLPDRSAATGASDIFCELCEKIFSSRQGDCLTIDQLRDLYESKETIKCERLAHTVSCYKCLEAVNNLLGLSSLNERYQMESSNTETPPRDQGDPPATSGGDGGARGISRSLRSRRRETIEHRPQELRIAVNGFFVGRQKLGLPINELALKLNLEEKISFIELFSEQGLLLTHFSVTPPTDGDIEQREEVEFGEGRALETAVSFETQWPTLKVVYRDPLVAQLQDVLVAEDADVVLETSDAHDGADVVPDRVEAEAHFLPTERHWSLSALRSQVRGLFTAQFWLRPGAITAVFALLLLATVLIVLRRPQPVAPITVTTILQRATSAEDSAVANLSTTTHRTLQIEERRGSLDGDVLARQRVEVWQSAAKGVIARRLYDDQGRLLAGEWARSDNVTTLYHHGARPQLRPSGTIRAPLSLENVWQLSPSAKDFIALVGQSQNVRLEERANQYILSFDGNGGTSPQKLIHARLTLNSDDLHAVEQSLLVQQGNETRAYRIIETSFERRPNDAVAPAMFEPELDLLSSIEPESRSPRYEPSTSPEPRSARVVIATPALEVEVLHLLNQANAFMGEQVSVTRSPEGSLSITGLVETEERKSELLRVLSTVRNNPAVHIKIETVAAAALRERPKSPSNITVERVEATEGSSPVFADLKKKFSEDEARRFADRVMTRSRQARRHALALKQLSERFSLADLRSLPEADRVRWIGLLQAHARDFQREAGILRQELQQVFPDLAGDFTSVPKIDGDAEMQGAVRSLYELGVACDEDVRQSFAISAQSSSVAQVKTKHFWQSLRGAEALATQILNAR